MTLLWLCVGLAVLAAGNIWMKKGAMSIAAAGRTPELICSVLAVLLSGISGIVFAASAAIQRQSAFLLLMLLVSSVYYAFLAGAIASIFRPVPAQGVVWKREGMATAVCLIVLIIAGRGTFGAGHPDAVAGKGYGIIFLGILFAEIFFMMATSMSGYRRIRRKRSLPPAFALLLTAAGLVMMMCAGLIVAEQAEHLAGLKNIHPAVCGLAAGAAVGGIQIPALQKEMKSGGRKTMSVLWGPSSLMLSGGLGISCMIMPITISYTVEMAAVFALILLILYIVCGIVRKQTGRVQAVIVIAFCSEMMMWLVMRLSKGLY